MEEEMTVSHIVHNSGVTSYDTSNVQFAMQSTLNEFCSTSRGGLCWCNTQYTTQNFEV